MRWLKRIFRAEAGPPRPAAAAEADAWLRSGYDSECRGDAAGADRYYRQIIELDPEHAEAHYFLGRMAIWDQRVEEAVVLFQRAVDRDPREATYQFQLGNALLAASRFEDAATAFGACVALLPDCTDVRINYTAALIELNRREEARVELERLQALIPEVSQVHFNLGGILREYGRVDDAIATYRRALKLAPDHAPSHANLLLQMNYSANCDAAAIFAEHRRFGEVFARRYLAPRPERAWPRRLRVGYVSPDFRAHVVSYFIEPILANHDRARFEIFCYHCHRETDLLTERLRGYVEHWLDCEDLSDDKLAARIRADGIDILVDLAGHTAGNRMTVFAMKPAPLQATYLGYPNTTGLRAVDYHITDDHADPAADSDRFYVESQLRLPVSYFCYRPAVATPEVGQLPAAAARALTFGCFNNFPKMSGAFFDMAAQVLAAVPGSRLMLKSRPLSIPGVAQSVHERFARAGVDPARIVIRGWEADFKSHLEIYRAIDIALDSFPYNGATTTCEALWMGVPVVTRAGDRHAGRMGSSLLNAVGLGELVARDADEYAGIAARLAGDTARLAELRGSLRERMQRSRLMDEAGFTRDLERGYLEIWQRALHLQSQTLPGASDSLSVAERLQQARLLREAGKLADAVAVCEDILRRQPDQLDALKLLWDLGFDGEAPGASIDWLLKAIAAGAGVAIHHHMLGCALQAQGKAGDAIASFRRALELDPTLAKSHNNLGCLLEAAGNTEEAAGSYRIAIRLDPQLGHALYNLGNIHKQRGEPQQAIRSVERALAAEPGHADWRCNLGNLYYEQSQFDEAIANLHAAIALDPSYERAYLNLGVAKLAVGHVEAAATAFRKALELKPRNMEAEAWLLLLLHYRQGDEAQNLFDRHRSWADRHARKLLRVTGDRARGRGADRRLNIGYVSPDFRRHPVAYFIEPVLSAHDRDACNVFCYSSSENQDDVTQRLRGMCRHWRDISRFSDDVAADQMRADGIDILVDLAGHTAGGRLLIFGRRPAPVQVTWLGYPGTTGLATMDYRLTDAVADPAGESERFHTETLVRLPRGFLCYAPPPDSPAPDMPLPGDRAVTFACFNNLAKITPQMIALWSELLRALPGARLVLKSYGLNAGSARGELQTRFSERGVGAERLDLRPADTSFERHLERYWNIDIGLDVFPYNGTTTTCEALWMGVPVVTLAGRTHVSRVGASILGSAGLTELVAHTPAEYLQIALRLAADAGRRRLNRAQQRERLRASQLFDGPGFTRALESAYRQMWAARRTRTMPENPKGADNA